ncbi:MAG: baeRF11 domain-containing protein [Aeromicrobium sp.]
MNNTDQLTFADVRKLAQVHEPGCVSIYIPSTPGPIDSDVARLEVKNRFRDAVHQLQAAGAGRELINEIAARVDALLDDDDFWRNKSNSLAVFVSPAFMFTYRLPGTLDGLTQVSDRLYLKPLMDAFTFGRAAFVLALSKHSVRLIAVKPDRPAARVQVAGMPKDIESEIPLDLTNDRSTLGRRISEDPKVRLREFAQAVDRKVQEATGGSDWPLIIAAAEPLSSIYRSISTSRHLAPGTISGSSDERSIEELASSARLCLDELHADELTAVKTEFEERPNEDLASTKLDEIGVAAVYRAIGTLFVDVGAHVPGDLDEENGEMTLDTEDDASNHCVVDEILRRAILSDAKILALGAGDVPGGGPVAALFRFAPPHATPPAEDD